MVDVKGSKPHILLIDYNARECEDLATFLLSKKYRVDHADTCDKGWSYIENGNTDVVILEADMPGTSTIEFLSRIKAHNDDLPVIFMTGGASVAMTATALKAGASDFITKPLNHQDLYHSIKRLLHLKETKELHRKILPYSDFKMNINFPSDYGYITGAVHYLTENLRHTAMCRPGEISNVNLALYEAIANAIGHGNRENPQKSIYIEAHFNSEGVEYCIRDEGEGFQLQTVPDPTAGDRLNGLRGRGVYLMRSFMDQITYCGNGNEVRMIKKRTLPIKNK